MENVLDYRDQYARVFSRSPQLSHVKPSVWAEQNIIVPGKGMTDYNFNPYCKEIVDRLAPDDPCRKLAFMKGSQITASSGVIMPALGYIIKEDPHNTYYMVGTPELVKMAVEKLDLMIQGAKLQDYISYQVQKKQNRKSGDTDEIKSFSGGYIKIGAASNPKSIAQVDLGRIFLDDFDAMDGKSRTAGSLMDLIEMRAASNKYTYKLVMISTPLNKATSNIEPAFLLGDQRRWNVECPCCHEPIIFKWTVQEGDIINGLTSEKAACNGGIVYERNTHGQVIKKSVGYVCYRCGGWFDDRNKQQMLRGGYYVPTAVPISDDYFSYHVSSLYAPVGMFDWEYYAGKHNEANPPNQKRDEAKMQVLINTCWGETYEETEEAPEAKMLQRNTRDYAIGTVPERMAMEDGSGRIVMLGCAADLNGKKNDARLDYEVVGWAANGQRYSIKHGSIGTFVPMEGTMNKAKPRKKWTYEHGKPNSVWPEFEKVLYADYPVDTGRNMQILRAGMDSRHYTSEAFEFIDKQNGVVVGLMGNREDSPEIEETDKAWYAEGKSRGGYYVLNVLRIKDRLAAHMQQSWQEGVDEVQPAGFMNFPQPAGGLYGFSNYFEHYEAEHRVLVRNQKGTDTRALWVKKKSTDQNHFWDIAVYNLVMRDIAVMLEAKAGGMRGEELKNYRFKQFAEDVTAWLDSSS